MLIAEASQVRRGGMVVVATFACAILLSLVPLPDAAEPWRPAFLALTVIYWCLTVPARVGVVAAWVTGISMDLLVGALLGQHALALSVVAYFALNLRKRMVVAPGWQLALSVFAMVFAYQALLLWISSLQGLAPSPTHYWSVPVASVLIWPTVLGVLRELRLRYRVN